MQDFEPFSRGLRRLESQHADQEEAARRAGQTACHCGGRGTQPVSGRPAKRGRTSGPTNRRPVCRAAGPNVPDPLKGSTAKAPGLVSCSMR